MDKKITRLANSGHTSVLMFGKRWALSPGTWGVRVPTKRRPNVKSEVYKIDDEGYMPMELTGGMCITSTAFFSYVRLKGNGDGKHSWD